IRVEQAIERSRLLASGSLNQPAQVAASNGHGCVRGVVRGANGPPLSQQTPGGADSARGKARTQENSANRPQWGQRGTRPPKKYCGRMSMSANELWLERKKSVRRACVLRGTSRLEG